MNPTANCAKVFISYSSADFEQVDVIREALELRGVACWIAPRDLVPGREYAMEIIRGIECSAATMLMLSEQSNKSQFVRREVERAVSKGKPVIPVRIENVMPGPSLELFISSAHWIDVWQGATEAKMDLLVKSIGNLTADQAQADDSAGCDRLPSEPVVPHAGTRPARTISFRAVGAAGAGLLALVLFMFFRSAEQAAAPAAIDEPVHVAPTPASVTPVETVRPSTEPVRPLAASPLPIAPERNKVEPKPEKIASKPVTAMPAPAPAPIKSAPSPGGARHDPRCRGILGKISLGVEILSDDESDYLQQHCR